MKDFRINPDKEYVMKIMDGIFKKNGHCPCQVKEDEHTLCPCDKFVIDGECCCRLYIKDESNK